MAREVVFVRHELVVNALVATSAPDVNVTLGSPHIRLCYEADGEAQRPKAREAISQVATGRDPPEMRAAGHVGPRPERTRTSEDAREFVCSGEKLVRH